MRGRVGLDMTSSLRRTLTALGAVIIVGALAVGLMIFQPWRLWTITEVYETLPPVAQPSETAPGPASQPTASADPTEPVILLTGSFFSQAHATIGEVSIVEQPDGTRYIVLTGLETTDGPDLHVWLSDAAVDRTGGNWDVFDDGDYLDVALLKGNIGDQVYELPAGTDLELYRSLSIWCASFTVSFGAAELSAA